MNVPQGRITQICDGVLAGTVGSEYNEKVDQVSKKVANYIKLDTNGTDLDFLQPKYWVLEAFLRRFWSRIHSSMDISENLDQASLFWFESQHCGAKFCVKVSQPREIFVVKLKFLYFKGWIEALYDEKKSSSAILKLIFPIRTSCNFKSGGAGGGEADGKF